MTARPLYSGVPPSSQDGALHRQQIASALNNVLAGRINCVLDVTLDANAASTTVTDARISAFIAALPDPMTASAATELASGSMYITEDNRTRGSLTITHSISEATDRTFRLVVLG